MSRLEPTDTVWLTTESKLRGICHALTAAQQAGQTALIIAFFDDTLIQLENTFRASGIAYQRYALLYLSSLCQIEPGMAVTALAQNFVNVADQPLEPAPGAAASIIIAEHHPMLANEKDLLQTLKALPCARQIGFHSALTDPLLVRFGGPAVQKVVRQLGLDEQTSLSNPMIASAIHQAQTKIGKKVYAEITTRSAEEWFQLNLPE